MDDEFLELISLTDRIHRHCLNIVKAELEQLAIYSINPTQALILLKIGHSAMSPTELIVRGWYPGTNPSYNVKRLVEGELIAREPRARDRRSSALRLTSKGHHVRRLLLALYRRRADLVAHETFSNAEISAAAETLRRLENALLSTTETWGTRRARASAAAAQGVARRAQHRS